MELAMQGVRLGRPGLPGLRAALRKAIGRTITGPLSQLPLKVRHRGIPIQPTKR